MPNDIAGIVARLEEKVKSGALEMEASKPTRKRAKPSRFIDEAAMQFTPKKKKKPAKKKKPTPKHELDDSDTEEIDVLKSKHCTQPKRFDRMKRLEQDETRRSKNFLPAESDSEDEEEHKRSLAQLLSDATDSKLNHGQDVAEKLCNDRSAMVVSNKKAKADVTRRALEKMRAEKERRVEERTFAHTSSSNSSHAVTTTNSNNVNITVNHAPSNPVDVQAILRAADALLRNGQSTQPQQQLALPDSGVSSNGLPTQQQQLAALLDSVSSNGQPTQPQQQIALPLLESGASTAVVPYARNGAPLPLPVAEGAMVPYTGHSVTAPSARELEIQRLLDHHKVCFRGDRQEGWIQKIKRAHKLRGEGYDVMRGGYNSVDAALSAWLQSQMNKWTTLDPVKQRLLRLVLF